MKILVTGSEGHLMQAVIPLLVKQGHDVIGVDNLIKHKQRLRILDQPYTFVEGDLTDTSFVNDLFQQFSIDTVIQGAARVYGVAGFNKFCADILHQNITLHANVLRASVENGIKRVVLISSSMVYESEPNSNTQLLVEKDLDLMLHPKTSYGYSKFISEKLSQSYYEQYGLDYTIWRPFNIITPYEVIHNEQNFGHVFADYIRKIVIEKTDPLPILGDGQQVRCFTWYEDVANGITDYSFVHQSRNQSFNLSNDEPITMLNLAHLIHSEAINLGVDIKPLKIVSLPPFKNDVINRYSSSKKAQSMLNWKVTKGLKDSINACLLATLNKN